MRSPTSASTAFGANLRVPDAPTVTLYSVGVPEIDVGNKHGRVKVFAVLEILDLELETIRPKDWA